MFVLLFIFVKRQIMRFAMKSRRGPHVPLGHNVPKVTHTHTHRIMNTFKYNQCSCLIVCVYGHAFFRSCDKKLRPDCAMFRKLISSLVCCPLMMTDWGSNRQVRGKHTHTSWNKSASVYLTDEFMCMCVAGLSNHDYLYRMRALDAIRDTGSFVVVYAFL